MFTRGIRSFRWRAVKTKASKRRNDGKEGTSLTEYPASRNLSVIGGGGPKKGVGKSPITVGKVRGKTEGIRFNLNKTGLLGMGREKKKSLNIFPIRTPQGKQEKSKIKRNPPDAV